MDIPGLPARKAALRLLDAVLRRGETLDTAAHAALQGLHSSPDKALARALTSEALRWLVDIDALVDSVTRQTLPADSKPRAVLRVMLAGWLRLDTPPHAVIATGLPLLSGGPRRLAHGVFSALVRARSTLPAVPSLPPAAAARWGPRGASIAAGLAVPPPLDLTLRDLWRDPDSTRYWTEQLGGFSLMPGHVRLPRGDAVEALTGFADGQWWVQDLAASLPARLLGPGHGRRVLDLCAAPGGKTLQLAAAGWQVTALDSSAKRLERMQINLARTKLAAELIVADARRWEPDQPFDAILLDAPCTATGTCRRHPDVLHRVGARQISELADLQTPLLRRAQNWLQPQGQLVYAVCSLEADEGEIQAGKVDLALDPIRKEELPVGLEPTPEGWLRTDPGMLGPAGGLDGFFAARWRAA